MTDKVLLNSGYKEYQVPTGEPYANRFFQKKVKDKKGIKYFIDVYEYEIMDSMNYEFKLVCNQDKFWVRTTLYAIDCLTIEEVEAEIENIWKKCKFNYYERYDEDE